MAVSFNRSKAKAQNKTATNKTAKSFKKKEAPVEDEVIEAEVVNENEQDLKTDEPDQPLAKPANKSTQVAKPAALNREGVSTFRKNAESSGFSGDWGHEDLQMPRLSLVQSSGDLPKKFQYGSFVYNKQVQINDGGDDAFPLIILGANKFYQEFKEYEDEGFGRTFDTEDEAIAAGLVEGYNDEGTYAPASDLDVLFPLPDDCDFEGDYEFNGIKLARATFTAKGSAYSSVAKKAMTANMIGHLRGKKCYEGSWNMSSAEKSNTKTSWAVPVLKSGGLIIDNPDLGKDFLDFLKNEVI